MWGFIYYGRSKIYVSELIHILLNLHSKSVWYGEYLIRRLFLKKLQIQDCFPVLFGQKEGISVSTYGTYRTKGLLSPLITLFLLLKMGMNFFFLPKCILKFFNNWNFFLLFPSSFLIQKASDLLSLG